MNKKTVIIVLIAVAVAAAVYFLFFKKKEEEIKNEGPKKQAVKFGSIAPIQKEIQDEQQQEEEESNEIEIIKQVAEESALEVVLPGVTALHTEEKPENGYLYAVFENKPNVIFVDFEFTNNGNTTKLGYTNADEAKTKLYPAFQGGRGVSSKYIMKLDANTLEIVE